ncbi:hypothetical protein SODALDRAFT_34581 [Sodiomyces alkalinus F11]|uniref:Uncharacterized protein n=1 Tax=Sodiomyces alkalinus (strain CBS 110278 / VKM F-3762 / F11) TaxID=1314773 RepID=A0A3N2Q970_SODAK|nr:hypothetical protein SODALDRAFT_34581 [Sodiomyces alkalinus F11]ROT43247.1 hypothetical protein SODALDRAFT_34581 [Sodiomyces alkalinus F11]
MSDSPQSQGRDVTLAVPLGILTWLINTDIGSCGRNPSDQAVRHTGPVPSQYPFCRRFLVFPLRLTDLPAYPRLASLRAGRRTSHKVGSIYDRRKICPKWSWGTRAVPVPLPTPYLTVGCEIGSCGSVVASLPGFAPWRSVYKVYTLYISFLSRTPGPSHLWLERVLSSLLLTQSLP